MLTSENDDDLWLAKRISYQMPRGSDKSATHATIKLRKKRHKAARIERQRSPRGVVHTDGRGKHFFQAPLIMRTKPKRMGQKELDHSRRLWEVQVYFEIGFAEQKF